MRVIQMDANPSQDEGYSIPSDCLHGLAPGAVQSHTGLQEAIKPIATARCGTNQLARQWRRGTSLLVKVRASCQVGPALCQHIIAR
jgi:hypothetical protein